MASCKTTVKLERKIVEKNRRILMKNLCSKLAAMLPSYNPKVEISLYDQVSSATDYIKELRAKIEELKRKRESGKRKREPAKRTGVREGMISGGNWRPPVVDVRDLGAALEIVLIAGSDRKIKISDICSILERDGVDVLNVTFSSMADKCIYTFYSKAKTSRLGFDSENVYLKLNELVHL